jgi:hypothetical protein
MLGEGEAPIEPKAIGGRAGVAKPLGTLPLAPCAEMVTEGVRVCSPCAGVPFVLELTMAGPVGADGGAVGLPFTGEADGLCACWLKAKPPTAALEPVPAFAGDEACCPFVALAYEERALFDGAADGDADLELALMGVAEDWTVLDIRGCDECRSGTWCAGGCVVLVMALMKGVGRSKLSQNEAKSTTSRTSLQVARTRVLMETQDKHAEWRCVVCGEHAVCNERDPRAGQVVNLC